MKEGSVQVFRNTEFLADLVRGQAVRSVCFFSDGSAESREYEWIGELTHELFCKHNPGAVTSAMLPKKFVEVPLEEVLK